ncbi:MAG: DUF1573 domain-containing protein [Bacteroidetes bacterium]|nr:MAG: DUF1573 domain-containing protein [Bacteroidota bacterium]REK08006.1 MAG: DUF1573 domain-containing protein [Bacteroidota bacterium]REK32211.1 MAG: DUF1573 domain-containing protein [Bacteroidota bacterium]REK47363.1 MAG: DUF1573 domain-containing protein [Bacteroidota bacterium]
MKLFKLLFAFLLISATVVKAQERKVLGEVINENKNQAEFKFDNEEHNFGTIIQGESTTHEFKFTNTGNEPLIITKAEGTCGCTVPLFPKEPIMKGQTGVIKVTFNSSGKMGLQDKTVTITSNAKQNPMVLHMKGTINKPSDPSESSKTQLK